MEYALAGYCGFR